MSDSKVLIVGGHGQLGFELQRSAPRNLDVVAVCCPEIDITDCDSVERVVQHYQPDVMINASAYTAVDKAESEESLAWFVNHKGAENLALAADRSNIRPVHISTDFVFDDCSFRPCQPEDSTAPQSVYGQSKLAGERTVLRLMNEQDSISVVADQVGAPTWANMLAEVLWELQATNATGIYHCSDNGVASWYDFAVAIQEETKSTGLLDMTTPVKPIKTEAYSLPAKRPAYSMLDVSGTEQLLGRQFPHWRESLRSMLLEMKGV